MTDYSNSISFKHVIAALLDGNTPFPPTYLHRFSDLEPSDLESLRSIWQQINPARRINLLESLEELAEADTLVCFDDLSRMALTDSEPDARAAAIRLLWECEDPRLADQYMNMLESDNNPIVQASAANALGLYIYLGEIDEVSKSLQKKVEDSLLRVLAGNYPTLVRRRALESLGFSSRKEVPRLIREAYERHEKEWTASALFAMGRTIDTRWEKPILANLNNPLSEIQVEAIRAAGQLELASARQPLLDLLDNIEELDEEVQTAVIWSLSQIGGDSVRQSLENLMDEIDDEDSIDFLEDALDNLEFTDGFPHFDLFTLNLEDGQDLDTFIDLDDNTDDEDGNNFPLQKR